MNCPSCGGNLKNVSVIGFDDSFRCELCGGVWMANWVVNNVADGKALKIIPLGKGESRKLGTNNCPVDGLPLVRVSEESVPPGVRAQACKKCGGWWFVGDDLFVFAKGANTRQEYMRAWKKEDWATLAWPAFVLVLLMGGVVGGMYLVRQETRPSLNAIQGVTDLVIVDIGSGEVEVRFKSGQNVGFVELRKSGEDIWTYLEVQRQGEWYVVGLPGLEAGEYEIKVGEVSKKFIIK